MNDFILILNKPKDITSFSYIQKVRKEMNIKKIGHAGTLDPMAEGLMIVMANDATKFSDYLMKHSKTYYVEMELGYETNTLDLEGEVTNKINHEINICLDDVKDIVKKYICKFKQIPPMFSAIKKNGVKLYDLARKGIELELEGREVEITNIYDIAFSDNIISFRADVSSGTYIRALVRDIGRDLNTYGTMTKLIREKINNFSLNDVNKKISIEDIFDYKKLEVDNNLYKQLYNGMTKIIELKNISDNDKYLKIYFNNVFVGIVEINKKMGYTYYIKRSKYFKELK
ncbi:tRNA pseudouridine(55) synthase TruB [Streptobacillus moniliformis]|uniref:tRNA pseudouridine synthase B n=1 Tax=Streptobacillus moniliformis (strain ATCC 14647 / DSM 12112 / NCTC 10651 / 9901) TaxID=519441 RepID=D1AY31_STRM9|nr:tRNA pseudouridine(55) synthase TruB [Streptobacillus moniliformis]ACZ01207.1 tRNA pseudouridine synthase B [Streptobacillus moniliformis DSM 12112]AVL42434.1 tRNA pseudouridine(55) synthase TruB [Streptobacillus moniliformis]SQA13639.1 tRNA pseudouridine synthase B [Streptobacillus moniliformis]